ncbi:class I SAM-dependent methyltransferase [Candidatus Parcubacteria bacterium]|nr:MAG: class I SAM-dependent methyltransferase [Candidatus Parcubacteria bacterium]
MAYRYNKNLLKTYNQIATDFYHEIKNDTWADPSLKLFIKSLSRKSYVLDLGCGSGIDAKKMSKAGFRVIGIDISTSMIKISKRLVPKVKFKIMDIYNLKFKDKTFDGIFAKASLLHVPKKRQLYVLKNLNRVLKPSGKIMILVKEGRGERSVVGKEYGKPIKRFFSFFSEKETRRNLNNAGFKELKFYKVKKPYGHRSWLVFLAEKI